MRNVSKQEHLMRLEVGQSAPDFKAQDVEGNWVTLKSLLGDGKTLLVFYRGEWCPVSKKELAGLARDYARFKELNSRIVAVSSAEFKKSKELVRSLSLPFVVLSDPNLEAIDLYGVRVERAEIREDQGGSRLNEMYVRYVKRLERYAAPSVFIIDARHLIRYKFLSRDTPTDFPENEEVLARVREIS